MFASKDVLMNLIVNNLDSNFTSKNPTLKAFVIKDKENNYWLYDELYKIKVYFLKDKIIKLSEDLPGEQQIENCMIIIYSYKLDFKYHVVNDERFLEVVLLAYDFSIDFYQKRMTLTVSKEKRDINENTDVKLFLQLYLRSLILTTLNTNIYEYSNTLCFENMENDITNNLPLKEENLHRDFGAFKISLFKDNCERIKHQLDNEFSKNNNKTESKNNLKTKSKSKSKNTKLSKNSCKTNISEAKSTISFDKFNLEPKRLFLFNDNDEFAMPYNITKLNSFDALDEKIGDEYFSYNENDKLEEYFEIDELKNLQETDLIQIENFKNIGYICFNNFSLIQNVFEERDNKNFSSSDNNDNIQNDLKIKEFLKLKRYLNIE